MKSTLKWILSLAVGGLFVWLSARGGRFDALAELPVSFEFPILVGGDPDAVGSAHVDGPFPDDVMARPGWLIDLRYLASYFVILGVIHVLRVLRWAPLLAPLKRVPFSRLNRIAAVGFMAVFLLPFRLGEFVRPYLLQREYPEIKMSSVLATIVLERLVDGLMVSLLLFLVLTQLPTSQDPGILVAAYSALAVFGGALSVVVLLYWQKERAITWIGKLASRVSDRLGDIAVSVLTQFTVGLRALPNARVLATFLVLTMMYWGLNGLGIWWVARGFGMPVPVAGAYAMMGCVVVGMMIPNSPGNVGTFWFFLLLPLASYGLGADVVQATVFGLALYLMQIVQQTSFGLYFWLSRPRPTPAPPVSPAPE